MLSVVVCVSAVGLAVAAAGLSGCHKDRPLSPPPAKEDTPRLVKTETAQPPASAGASDERPIEGIQIGEANEHSVPGHLLGAEATGSRVAAAPSTAPRRKGEEGRHGLRGFGTGAGGGGVGHGAGYGIAGVRLSGVTIGGRGYGAAAAPRTMAFAGQPDEDASTEAYAHQAENDFRAALDSPLSTFAVDVDTAAYSNVRRFLTSGQRPPVDAVRIEELVNYFPYAYRSPSGPEPFAANVEVAACPWAPAHRLVRVGVKARDIDRRQRPASNLVFLVDVSGSMQPDNKLPLLKRSLAMLVESLDARDHVAMVVYAGASGLVLPSTRGDQQETIFSAIESLGAGGSTNGAAGIELAYEVAAQHFKKGGVNRVVLATDGDFNVGVTSEGELVRLIEDKAKSGVFLSVLGFGTGNYKDSTMEKLADKGNGNYAYVDTLQEGRKVLVEQMTGTLITVAKDVKLQIEFNPAKVTAWRQVGYENRQLRHQDFNNDKIDAGDIGAGHTVTALYEIVPVGVDIALSSVDPLKYQAPSKGAEARTASGQHGHELATVKIRYKPPTEDVSKLSSFVVADSATQAAEASIDFRFAAAVAEYGMLLRDSKHRGTSSWASQLALARGALGQDPLGYRAELVRLAERASQLPGPKSAAAMHGGAPAQW